MPLSLPLNPPSLSRLSCEGIVVVSRPVRVLLLPFPALSPREQHHTRVAKEAEEEEALKRHHHINISGLGSLAKGGEEEMRQKEEKGEMAGKLWRCNGLDDINNCVGGGGLKWPPLLRSLSL